MEIVGGGDGLKQKLIRGASEEDSFRRLVSASFGLPPGASIFDDFPVWSESNGARIRRVGLFEGAKLAATAALRLASLRVGSRKVPVGIIGCVATDPAYRGRGLATQLVRSLTVAARGEGAALAILFGSEPDLYARLGFAHQGEQMRVPLDSIELSLASASVSGTGTLGRGWVPGLFEALRFRPGGLILEPSDERWVSGHVNAEWHWLVDGDRVLAYACVGKGIDLAGMVHEWGGPTEHLHSLLASLRARAPGLQVLGCPKSLASAALRSDQEVIEPLCMVKELDASGARGVADSPDFWLWGIDGA